MKKWVQAIFEIDPRSAALFRFLIGICLAIDSVFRMFDARAHYSDHGAIPRNYVMNANEVIWSLFFLNGSTMWANFLLLVTAVFALFFAFGLYTRFANFMCWMLVVSVHNRNWTVLCGGDDLLRQLLFWTLFLPLERKYSIDNFRRMTQSDITRDNRGFFSFASAAIYVQLICVYIFLVLQRTSPVWWEENSGVYYIIQLDQLVTRTGRWLLNFHEILPALTWASMRLEMLGPLVLLIPWFRGAIRPLLFFAFFFFHLGMALTLKLGTFIPIIISAWTFIIPSEFWNNLAKRSKGDVPRFLNHILRSVGECWDRLLNRLNLKFVRAAELNNIPSSRQFRLNILKNCITAPLLVLIVYWNVMSLHDQNYRSRIPIPIRAIAQFLRLDQEWVLFAPYPWLADGWYVADGTLQDGKKVDILTGKETKWEKPELISDHMGSFRWIKFYMEIWRSKEDKNFLLNYGRYLCQAWNRKAPEGEKLENFDLYYNLETTLPLFQTSDIKKILVWRHWCYALPEDCEGCIQ